jgi:hypothetical protein
MMTLVRVLPPDKYDEITTLVKPLLAVPADALSSP